MAFFNEEMSDSDLFHAYLVNADKGLFESGNFCLDEDDYYILFKKIIKNYDEFALDYKYQCRLWGIYIRELVYRYAQSYRQLWPDLKMGMNADVQMLLDKYCYDEIEKNAVNSGKRRFDEKNTDIQGFCYDGSGEALRKIFNGRNFENFEYHFHSRENNAANRRYLEFLLKLSVLPVNYLPTRGIYMLLREAFVNSRCPYWSNESPSKIFLSKLRGILTNAGDGWKVHRNTIEAFRDRLFEFFTFVFSWRSCGYSKEEAEEALGQTFAFLSQNKESNYLYKFLQKEYDLLQKPVDKATVQKWSKKLFQFAYVLDKSKNIFYFKKSQGNVKFHLSTYLNNRDIRRINTILIKAGTDDIAKINSNGALVFANGGSVQNENLSILKLIKEKEIGLVWDDNVLSIKNPWYTPNCWFLLNKFGTDSAKTWDVSNDAYLAIPKELGKIECGEELLSAQQLSQENIELLLPETCNSGLYIYKLTARPNVNLEQILLNTSNGFRVELKLRDIEYVRTISNFKGSPTFVLQNLHSKIGIGQIEFEWPNYDDYSNICKGVRYTAANGIFTIKNETQNIICLDEHDPILGAISDLLRKRFPYIVLLPSNAKIWISGDKYGKMCHWFVGDKQLNEFALYGNCDSIKISNDSIEPSEWINDKNVFRLTEPKWNELLLKDGCTSEELGRLSSWIEPEFPEADVFFRWNEEDIQFKVVVTPEEKKTLEEIYGQEYGKGLACIYRILEIRGAYVTVGFSYKGKNFEKSFSESADYELKKRASIYQEFQNDKIKCGEFLKNHLLHKKEIQERCNELQRLYRDCIELLDSGVFDPENYDCVDALNKFRKLNCKIGPERIPFFDKDYVAIGKISYNIENEKENKVFFNEAKSILRVPTENTQDGWCNPNAIIFPKGTSIGVLLNGDRYFLVVFGDVDNLSSAWEYDEMNNIHYIPITKKYEYYHNDIYNDIPIIDGKDVHVDVDSFNKSEDFYFITKSCLYNIKYAWLKYNQNESFETDLLEILSKGMALILHSLPIEKGSFDILFSSDSNYYYNSFKETIPLKHLENHNYEKITTMLYDHKPIPAAELIELQNILGIKSINLLMEYIYANRKESDKRSLFSWVCGISSLDQAESYALNLLKKDIESFILNCSKKVRNYQFLFATLGFRMVGEESPNRVLLEKFTASNGFIYCFYEGVRWADNLKHRECTPVRMMYQYNRLANLVICDPKPVGSWKRLWTVNDNEIKKDVIKKIFSLSDEWMRKISLENKSRNNELFPVQNTVYSSNNDVVKVTYEDKKKIWENILLKLGVPVEDLSKSKYSFKPFYKFWKDEILEIEAKKIAAK